MNDCVNAEMRDRLPELLHGRLDGDARAAVLAHVDACADCRAELELLRAARATLVAAAPRVDLNYVIQALPKPPAARPLTRVPRRLVWTDWRVAAAVTLLVAGGTSVAVLNRGSTTVQPSTPAVAAPSVAAAPTAVSVPPAATQSAPSAEQSPRVAAAPGATAEVASAEPTPTDAPVATSDVGAHLGDLNAQQLQSLLKDIDKLQPVPVTDPDPVTLRVTTSSSSDGEGA